MYVYTFISAFYSVTFYRLILNFAPRYKGVMKQFLIAPDEDTRQELCGNVGSSNYDFSSCIYFKQQ